MTNTITLPRSVVEQALEHLTCPVDEPVREAFSKALEQPQGEQEPVAWMTEDGRVATDDLKRSAMASSSKASFNIPLYTHPQPNRQPLTEADLYNIASNYFADEWAQKQAVMMLKDHGIGGEA